MERAITEQLISWKDSPDRKPLIIRGARQVGKTWILKDFGKRCFEDTIICNFDVDKELHQVFENKSPDRIIGLLELVFGRSIIPGKTLLVFDEVQECPNALNALKYFFEEKRELHIIAAGSLLGILLGRYSYPVGSVDLLEMSPMDFSEYIKAVDPILYNAYHQMPLLESIPDIFHRKLTDAYHQYLIIGGMPECVADWANKRDYESVLRKQKTLIKFYEGDFGKHSKTINAAKCLMVFQSVPFQLAKENEKFLYGAVRKGARAVDLEDAVTWNIEAGLFNRVHNVSKIECPLAAFKRIDAFKLFLHDTALIKVMANVPNSSILLQDSYQFKGQLAENYLLEQITGKFEGETFYYSDQACREIDFLLQVDSDIIPIEVKSGANVKSISLKNYLAKRNPRYAIRFSENNFSQNGNLLNLPLYMASRLWEYF